MRIKWRFVSALVVPFALMGFATGAFTGGPAQGASSKSSPDRSYVLKTTSEPIGLLDPGVVADGKDANPLANIYDQLVRQTQKGVLVPGLAKSWTTPNPTTFTMNLQPNVKFQDGTPFDSAAVANSIQRDQRPTAPLQVLLTEIVSVTTPNSLTVTLHLKDPVAGSMAAIFEGAAGEVPSPTALAKYGSQYGVTAAVGAGPYELVDFSADNTLNLKAWSGYWDKPAQMFAGIDFSHGADLTFGLHPALVSQGQLDVTGIKSTDIPTAKGTPNVKYISSPSEQETMIVLNWSVAPWDNQSVRQALEYSLNRPALNNATSGGLDTAAYQPIPPQDVGYSKSLNSLYPYNPTKAKQLMTAAGYSASHPLSITLGELNYSTYPTQAEAIQQMMNAVGFQVSIVPYLASAAAQLVFVQKKFPAATTGFAPATSGPLSILEQCCSATGNFNLSKLTLSDIQPLLDQMSTLSKPSAALLQKATKLVMQGAYFIPLSFQNSVLVYGPKVHNVVFAPSYANSGDFLESPFIYVSK